METLAFSRLTLATMLLSTIAVHAAPSTNVTAEAASEGAPIPKSVYAVPNGKADGRDPFFPGRTGIAAPVTPVKPTSPNVVLTLNGVSPGFAIINGKTIAVGEETEIVTSNGRIQVRCVEVREKDNLVIVEVDGERQELKLRSGI